MVMWSKIRDLLDRSPKDRDKEEYRHARIRVMQAIAKGTDVWEAFHPYIINDSGAIYLLQEDSAPKLIEYDTMLRKNMALEDTRQRFIKTQKTLNSLEQDKRDAT